MAVSKPRILIVRNDKLGDFLLAWPAIRALKGALPGATIAVLVREYTREAAEMCPWIDEVVIDPGPLSGWRNTWTLAGLLRRGRFDAMITLYSTARVGVAGLLARIPYRLSPATKAVQLCYNHRERQRRSRSEKPEWRYNLELAWRLLRDFGSPAAEEPPRPPYLTFPAGELERLRNDHLARLGLPPNALLVVLHPGSGGSASNLSTEQYATLLAALDSAPPLAFLVSAGPGEEEAAGGLARRVAGASLLVPRGLRELAQQIACADLFISGSTGPLHLAGALDIPTAAFYTRRRSATPLRWQTLNAPERRLAFTPPEWAGECEMAAIDLEGAAREISARFLRGPRSPAR